MSICIGANNLARRVKKLYIGIDGKARKVKKVYIGVNNIARLCFKSESSKYNMFASGLTTGRIYFSQTSKTDIVNTIMTVTAPGNYCMSMPDGLYKCTDAAYYKVDPDTGVTIKSVTSIPVSADTTASKGIPMAGIDTDEIAIRLPTSSSIINAATGALVRTVAITAPKGGLSLPYYVGSAKSNICISYITDDLNNKATLYEYSGVTGAQIRMVRASTIAASIDSMYSNGDVAVLLKMNASGNNYSRGVSEINYSTLAAITGSPLSPACGFSGKTTTYTVYGNCVCY